MMVIDANGSLMIGVESSDFVSSCHSPESQQSSYRKKVSWIVATFLWSAIMKLGGLS